MAGEGLFLGGAGHGVDVPRLRRSDCSKPGITRRRRGRGFSYHWAETGQRISDPELLQRISDLVLPPAWDQVWICPIANGHLQAVGTDAAGRKQYRYHDQWRLRRDNAKFDEMLDFARTLPALRAAVEHHLVAEGFGRERVLACAVRLLDVGFFRIGAEIGRSEDGETFGLTTMRKQHVTISGDEIIFEYEAKGGKQQVQRVVDPAARAIITALKRRRGGSDELLAWKQGRRWSDVQATHVNDWIKSVTGGDYSAKDFRTWNATVLAALALAVSGEVAKSKTASKRAMSRATQEVAHFLGNTATVARNSYIDPRVFDRYLSGWTVSGVLPDLGEGEFGQPAIHVGVEDAVLDLLERKTDADGVERVGSLAS